MQYQLLRTVSMSRPQLMWSSTTLSDKSQDAQTTPLRSLQGLTSRVRSSRSNARSQAARSKGPHHTSSWVTGYMWVLLQELSVLGTLQPHQKPDWKWKSYIVVCTLGSHLKLHQAPLWCLQSFTIFIMFRWDPCLHFSPFVGFVSQIFVVAIMDVLPMKQNFHCIFNAF